MHPSHLLSPTSRHIVTACAPKEAALQGVANGLIGETATLPPPAAGQPMGETATLLGSESGGGYLAAPTPGLAAAHSPPVVSQALSPHASRLPSLLARRMPGDGPAVCGCHAGTLCDAMYNC